MPQWWWWAGTPCGMKKSKNSSRYDGADRDLHAYDEQQNLWADCTDSLWIGIYWAATAEPRVLFVPRYFPLAHHHRFAFIVIWCDVFWIWAVFPVYIGPSCPNFTNSCYFRGIGRCHRQHQLWLTNPVKKRHSDEEWFSSSLIWLHFQKISQWHMGAPPNCQ